MGSSGHYRGPLMCTSTTTMTGLNRDSTRAAIATRRLVARRLAWFEGVLRLTFAARRDRERLVRYMIAKAPEDTAVDSANEEKAPTGVESVVMEHFGVDVAIAQLQFSKEIIVLERDDAANHGPGSDAPLVKGR